MSAATPIPPGPVVSMHRPVLSTLRRAALRGALSFALLGAAVAQAQVTVSDPWVRGTVPSQMSTGAFMKLTAARPARLLGASSPVAGVVEVHEMALVDNVMHMRAVDVVDLPAGRSVELRPGGYHLMLIDLDRQLKPGETVPVTLLVEQDGKRQRIEVAAPVRPLTWRERAPAGSK